MTNILKQRVKCETFYLLTGSSTTGDPTNLSSCEERDKLTSEKRTKVTQRLCKLVQTIHAVYVPEYFALNYTLGKGCNKHLCPLSINLTIVFSINWFNLWSVQYKKKWLSHKSLTTFHTAKWCIQMSHFDQLTSIEDIHSTVKETTLTRQVLSLKSYLRS